MWSRLKGWKTIIWSGSLVLIGGIATVLDALDIPMLDAILPEKYKPFAPLLISLVGVITGALRMITSTPWGQKEESP